MSNNIQMRMLKPRCIWLDIAAISAALVAASVVLTAWFKLEPCPFCIFQRLLFMILSLLTLAAFLRFARPVGRTTGILALPTAVSGMGAAAYPVREALQPLSRRISPQFQKESCL